MKTVTIPTCANPFVVIVNGIKYTYPAGATVEVPDDVAEVIEQHEEAKTEPAPVQPPYSGDDILAAAKAYTDKKVAEGGGGASGEVVDLTGVFDYALSIQAGGEICYAKYDSTELINRLRNGAVTMKVSMAGLVVEQRVLAQIMSNNGYAQFVTFAELNGALLYLYTRFENDGGIAYSCKQVPTQPYNPS